MPGKYAPLEHYLNEQPKSTNDLTMTFGQIERILNDRLPASARKYGAWWANEVKGSHVEAHAWLNAGWKVEGVDFGRGQVRFVRAK